MGIAVAGRIVWVAQGGHGLARIDAATNRLLGTVRLDVYAERVAADGGAIWVGGPTTDPTFETAGAVARIDAATGRVREIVPSGLPTGLAAGVGAVGSPSGTLLAGRWSASRRTRAPQP